MYFKFILLLRRNISVLDEVMETMLLRDEICSRGEKKILLEF